MFEYNSKCSQRKSFLALRLRTYLEPGRQKPKKKYNNNSKIHCIQTRIKC